MERIAQPHIGRRMEWPRSRIQRKPTAPAAAQARGKSGWLSAALLGSILGAICFGSRAYAIEISVCKKGCDFVTIQAAIDAASDGDILRVAGGRYAEHLIIDKSLTIRGAGANIAIIDGEGAGRVRGD